MRLLSDTRSRRLNLPGQCHILRCRWYWKAVCPAPDINRKRTCTPTCKAACRSVPPPWRTAAQSLLHPARRGRAIFISRGILQCAGTSTEAMKATNTEYSAWALHKLQSPMPTKPYLFLIATSHTLFNPIAKFLILFKVIPYREINVFSFAQFSVIHCNIEPEKIFILQTELASRYVSRYGSNL